jgi:hypothetical protein
LTGQFEVQVTGSRQNAGSKKPVSAQTKNASEVHVSWKRNGLRRRGPSFAKGQLRATGLFPMCVAVPRNKSQQFRPAGTRVAPPGTKRTRKKPSAAYRTFFLRPAFHFESANNLRWSNEIQKVFLDYFKP